MHLRPSRQNGNSLECPRTCESPRVFVLGGRDHVGILNSEVKAVFNRVSDNRMVWLLVGMFAGLAVAYVWPHEPAFAETADRADTFGMVTTRTGLGGAEAVFVLDYLTGRLVGAAINPRIGKFTQAYLKNVAADLNLTADAKPQFAMVAGFAELPKQGRSAFADSILYIAELKSGKVNAYGFPFTVANRAPNSPQPMVLLGGFAFREAVGE